MHNDYEDIRNRIAEPPKWWDENGVPRYEAFAPALLADIYASNAALLVVACQACGVEFEVVTSSTSAASLSMEYGDPPNIGCCPAGPTMLSEPKRLLQYWLRQQEWEQVPVVHREQGEAIMLPCLHHFHAAPGEVAPGLNACPTCNRPYALWEVEP